MSVNHLIMILTKFQPFESAEMLIETQDKVSYILSASYKALYLQALSKVLRLNHSIELCYCKAK